MKKITIILLVLSFFIGCGEKENDNKIDCNTAAFETVEQEISGTIFTDCKPIALKNEKIIVEVATEKSDNSRIISYYETTTNTFGNFKVLHKYQDKQSPCSESFIGYHIWINIPNKQYRILIPYFNNSSVISKQLIAKDSFNYILALQPQHPFTVNDTLIVNVRPEYQTGPIKTYYFTGKDLDEKHLKIGAKINKNVVYMNGRQNLMIYYGLKSEKKEGYNHYTPKYLFECNNNNDTIPLNFK